MQKHEHFEELCALVPIGQLTATEYEELGEHLKRCGRCRHATEDFALVLDQPKQGLAAIQGRCKNSESNSANTKAELTEANAELSRLQTQIADANNALKAARLELASARSAKDEEDAALVVQQFKLTELSEQIKNERASADRERQLSQTVSDARELMGARNLHIIDVSDVDGDGKAKKSFGRVFFT